MPYFGATSLARLQTVHPSLQRVMHKAIVDGPDFTILCGHRSKEEQEAAFARGASKLHFPRSKHNKLPSLAVDIAPWPIDWDDVDRFRFLAGYVMGVASQCNVKLRWGADWDRDYRSDDERFIDMPHFELFGPP